jgi:hypothetical protein
MAERDEQTGMGREFEEGQQPETDDTGDLGGGTDYGGGEGGAGDIGGGGMDTDIGGGQEGGTGGGEWDQQEADRNR